MIPAESRMREIRTSGSTSGGVETDRMGAGLSTKRKRGQEAPDPTRHRATPRLYFFLYTRSIRPNVARSALPLVATIPRPWPPSPPTTGAIGIAPTPLSSSGNPSGEETAGWPAGTPLPGTASLVHLMETVIDIPHARGRGFMKHPSGGRQSGDWARQKPGHRSSKGPHDPRTAISDSWRAAAWVARAGP